MKLARMYCVLRGYTELVKVRHSLKLARMYCVLRGYADLVRVRHSLKLARMYCVLRGYTDLVMARHSMKIARMYCVSRANNPPLVMARYLIFEVFVDVHCVMGFTDQVMVDCFITLAQARHSVRVLWLHLVLTD